MEHENSIESYLMGEMTKEERETFEKAMANDPFLNKEVIAYEELEAFLGNRDWPKSINNKQKNKYSEALNRLEVRGVTKSIATVINKQRQKKSPPFWSIAAAMAVITFGFIMYFSQPKLSNEELYAQYYSLEDLPSVVERNSDNASDESHEILKLFNNGNYHMVAEKMSAMPIKPELFIYYGIALLELNRPEEAIVVFRKLSQSSQLDAPKGFWYLGLAYLKNQQPEQALSAFENLLLAGGKFKRKETEDLIQKIHAL